MSRELDPDALQRDARRAERALQRLRYILDPKDSPPLWSASQASWYLIGIYIDGSELPCKGEAGMYAWLPEAAGQFNGDPWIRDIEVDDSQSYVSGFCKGESRTAAEWLKHSLDKEYRPIWADVAIADQHCRSVLPNKLLARLGATPGGEKRQVHAAKIRHSRDPKSQAIERLKAPFLVWFAECPKKSKRVPCDRRGRHMV
jgi:hypothetical protein